jgi:acetate---CoA ligase (ADP-forming)
MPPSSAASLREALLSPRSVALIGQSNDAGKTAGRPLKFLRQAHYAGRVYPVNARRDEVLGERAWPSLDALPEVPEHAYIVTPAGAAMEAIEACGRAGVKVATVLADGFAEAGDAGLAREARLREIVSTTGMRIVGPSSLGVVNLRNGTFLTANAAFDEPDLPVGRIFAASRPPMRPRSPRRRAISPASRSRTKPCRRWVRSATAATRWSNTACAAAAAG